MPIGQLLRRAGSRVRYGTRVAGSVVGGAIPARARAGARLAEGHLRGGLAKAAFGTVVAGAAGAGVIGATLDTQGPYQDIQQSLYGDPSAFRSGIRGSVKSAISPDVVGTADMYYGQPVNVPPRGSSGRTSPVPGEAVFGMWNTRR